jgi:anti-sigma factor RsiW
MNCSNDLIEAYMDEELDPASHLTVAEHLSTCQSCAQTHARFCKQSASIRSVAPYYHAPAHLQQSIREALRQAAAAETAATEHRAPWRWVAIAASILLVVSVSWNLRRPQAQSAGKELVAENILSDHIRSLIGTHLLDVPSTDQHTVKPWFNGKLDFSPDVKDFASQGFPLIGGRLDYLTGRTVAALVYRRRQHTINLFTWPADSPPVETSNFSRNGYNVVHWTHRAMTCWAVSDIGVAELEQFRDLYEK